MHKHISACWRCPAPQLPSGISNLDPFLGVYILNYVFFYIKSRIKNVSPFPVRDPLEGPYAIELQLEQATVSIFVHRLEDLLYKRWICFRRHVCLLGKAAGLRSVLTYPNKA